MQVRSAIEFAAFRAGCVLALLAGASAGARAQAPAAAFLDASGAVHVAVDGAATSYPATSGITVAQSGLAAAQAVNGDTVVVGVQAGSGTIVLNTFSLATGTWSGWQNSNGVLDPAGGLTAAMAPNGVIWFTGRDTGNRFWIDSWNGSTFGGWVLLDNGIFSSDAVPQVAIPADGSVYVIGKDIGGRIWSDRYVPGAGTFSGWINRGAVMIGQPSVAAGIDGFIYVTVRNAVSSPVYVTQIPANNGTGANTWINGGGLIVTDPLIASQGTSMYISALAGDAEGDPKYVYEAPFSEGTQSFGSWTYTGRTLMDETIGTRNGDIYIAGRDSGGAIWWYNQGTGVWAQASGSAAPGALHMGASAGTTNSVSYNYDSQGRLTSSAYGSSAGTVTVTYSYDAAGNRTTVVTQ